MAAKSSFREEHFSLAAGCFKRTFACEIKIKLLLIICYKTTKIKETSEKSYNVSHRFNQHLHIIPKKRMTATFSLIQPNLESRFKNCGSGVQNGKQ